MRERNGQWESIVTGAVGLVGRSGSHAHWHWLWQHRYASFIVLFAVLTVSSSTLCQQPDSVIRTLQIFHRRDTVLAPPEKSPCSSFHDQYLRRQRMAHFKNRAENSRSFVLIGRVGDTNLGRSTALKPYHEDAILATLTTNLRNSSPLSSKRPQWCSCCMLTSFLDCFSYSFESKKLLQEVAGHSLTQNSRIRRLSLPSQKTEKVWHEAKSCHMSMMKLQDDFAESRLCCLYEAHTLQEQISVLYSRKRYRGTIDWGQCQRHWLDAEVFKTLGSLASLFYIKWDLLLPVGEQCEVLDPHWCNSKSMHVREWSRIQACSRMESPHHPSVFSNVVHLSSMSSSFSAPTFAHPLLLTTIKSPSSYYPTTCGSLAGTPSWTPKKVRKNLVAHIT